MERILNARITQMVEELSIADVITTRADERTGYRARFTSVGGGAVKKYDGTVDFEKAVVTPVELNLNKQDYFAFSMDDVEALKTNPAQIDKHAKKQARAISRNEDSFILSEIAKGGATKLTRTIKTPEQAYNTLVDMNKELSKKDAPHDDRFLVIDFDTLGMLEKDTRFTTKYEILENGVVQGASINGSTLIVVNTLPEGKILGVQKGCIGFERFLDKLEIMRLQNAFADGVRGLSVYDGKILESDFAVVVTVTTGEATK